MFAGFSFSNMKTCCFSQFYDGKLNIFGFRTVGQTKWDIWGCKHGDFSLFLISKTHCNKAVLYCICVILTTDESIHSSLSSDSCEYYQTEIFDQLPSIQASRPGQNTQGLSEACAAYQGGPEPGDNISHGHLSRRPKDKDSMQPLRNMAMCIQGKRDARWESLLHIPQICFFSFYILLWQSSGKGPCCHLL